MSHIAITDDFLKNDPATEIEQKLFTNLRVSVEYIAEEWQIN